MCLLYYKNEEQLDYVSLITSPLIRHRQEHKAKKTLNSFLYCATVVYTRYYAVGSPFSLFVIQSTTSDKTIQRADGCESAIICLPSQKATEQHSKENIKSRWPFGGKAAYVSWKDTKEKEEFPSEIVGYNIRKMVFWRQQYRSWLTAAGQQPVKNSW